MGKPVIRNWRQIAPRVGHDNAIVWRILGPARTPAGAEAPTAMEAGAAEADTSDQAPCLARISGVARHALQGGKKGDSHVHYHACVEVV